MTIERLRNILKSLNKDAYPDIFDIIDEIEE